MTFRMTPISGSSNSASRNLSLDRNPDRFATTGPNVRNNPGAASTPFTATLSRGGNVIRLQNLTESTQSTSTFPTSSPASPTSSSAIGSTNIPGSLNQANHSTHPGSHTRTSIPPASTYTPTATITITENDPQTELVTSNDNVVGTLYLRAVESPASRRRIQWAEDVVDNEGMGRKSSKVCCIFHPPHTTEASSSSSSSDSDSDSSSLDSDSESDDSDSGVGCRLHTDARHNQDHNQDPGHAHSHDHNHNRRQRRYRPNAYERVPKLKSRTPQEDNERQTRKGKGKDGAI